ncbi:MAG: ATP-binding protein [Clostridia bacterium]|nr:ATP-binding protein [Clostridia bacterium]
METIKTLQFRVAFGAVRHFGRNLYSTNPPAIAELVANAWDAYAKECRVYIKNNSMLIIDDGIGMTDWEFQNRYATSGNEKDTNIRKPEEMKERPYMGKKGIGKFSAFSLTDEYELFTKSDSDEEWKHIVLEQQILSIQDPTYDVPIKRIDNLKEIIEKFGIVNFDISTGTAIYLPKLKRNVTATTIQSLKKLLSHRFSITTIMNDGNFAVSIHTDEEEIDIDLKQHFYYNDIEYLHYFGYSEDEIVTRFPGVEPQRRIRETDFASPIKGWIGSVSIPSTLVVDDMTALKGVCIYINGKLVDEDILKSARKDRISDTYIVGEVDADYLGLLSEDVVLSSREGLFLDDEEVVKIKAYLDNVKKTLMSKWAEMRKNRPLDKQEYLQRMLINPRNKQYYDALSPKSKERFDRYAQKLFDRPNSHYDESMERLNNLMFSSLMQIVNNEDIQELIEKDKVEEAIILDCFSEIFNLSEINHALRLRDSVKSNLRIISELEKYIESGEVEKVFENHLAKNPWLIEPTWMSKAKSVHTQDYHQLLSIDNGDITKLYTDIIVEVSDETYPVIVEIKREKATAYSTPDVNQICAQIYNYQKSLSEELSKELRISVPASNIKSYFICGKKAFDKLDDNDRMKLQRSGIELRCYDELIRTAKRIFEVNIGEDLEGLS